MISKIISTVSIKGRDLDEIEEVLGFRPEVEKTRKKLKPKFNPYFNSTWGDFDWLRSQFSGKYEVRCFATSEIQLLKSGITGHIGMYDMVDKDGVLDFYIGIPKKLDKRAKRNGFKSNVAWLFCHEWCHGQEQKYGTPDRTHDMEKQGKLKELLFEQIKKEEMSGVITKLKEKLGMIWSSFIEKRSAAK